MKNKRLLATLFLILFTLNVTGCKGQATEVPALYTEDLTQVQSDELMKYKNSYVGDNSAVINIISKLPGNRYDPSFHLQTKKEPYGITVNYQVDEEVDDESYLNFWEEANTEEILKNNAILLFSLIPNVEMITFEVDGINHLSNHSYDYRREELESRYNLNLIDLSRNQQSLEDFLNSQ